MLEKDLKFFLDDLRQCLRVSVALKKEFTLAITGSISREDYCLDEQGEVLADIDALVILEDIEDKAIVCDYLSGKLKSIVKEHNVDLDIMFGLNSALQKNVGAHYFQSIRDKYILYNGLGIDLDNVPSVVKSVQLKYAHQSFFYYQSKYRLQPSQLLSQKIVAIWNILNELHGVVEIGNLDSQMLYKNYKMREYAAAYTNINMFGLTKSMELYVDEQEELYKDNLLPSSIYFLDNYKKNLSNQFFFHQVREYVFYENLGMQFEGNIMKIT
ncbi:hypothetical protein HB852_07195 [Listeria grandensis]|uniref:hypothetical protein n=1 Tax=Listeria grandensis TaxID=1494963 RepID=UPI0016253C0A|nr:hypothetical protein [Listeria grandensis]MBC1474400.1 hypothetical protein [Listeria grandensis]